MNRVRAVSHRTRANASFVIVASLAATAGVSTCVPGVVSVITCMSTPSRRARLPVRDVAVAAHHDVVVARVVQIGLPSAVDA